MEKKIITWDNWCEWCGTWMFNTFETDEWDKFLETAKEIYNATDFAFHEENATHILEIDTELSSPIFVKKEVLDGTN